MPTSAEHHEEVLQRILDTQKIDTSLLKLSPDDLQFLQKSTGIDDEKMLKKHICAIQAQAFAVFPYPCIHRFAFTRIQIARFPAYRRVLRLVKDRPEALLLDIGCCFGADARKAVLDGYPAKNIIASDLHPEFWELGHQLFRDTGETMPISFVAGDVFDPDFLSAVRLSQTPQHIPLPSVTKLTDLQSRLSVIHASNFFHLFDQSRQAHLARLLASLLSPEPGSLLFGSQIGATVAGIGKERGKWAHSPESWKALWHSIFGANGCEVQAVAKTAPDWVVALGMGTHLLIWSVTRR